MPNHQSTAGNLYNNSYFKRTNRVVLSELPCKERDLALFTLFILKSVLRIRIRWIRNIWAAWITLENQILTVKKETIKTLLNAYGCMVHQVKENKMENFMEFL